MTDTGRWLEQRRAELLRRAGLGAALVTSGLMALALGVGVWLGRLGVYGRVPEAMLGGWLLVAGALSAGVWLGVRAARRVRAGALAGELERAGGLRRGAVGGFADPDAASGSPGLVAAADRRMAGWLVEHGAAAFAPVRRRHGRALWRGAAVAAGGIALFASADPAHRHAGFWTPLASIARARGPVLVAASREAVQRGDSVTVTVRAAGRPSATLFVRAPGETWSARPLTLDSAGRAAVTLGPLDSDRYVRATAAGRASDTLHIRVAVPAFLSELALLARYPEYLALPDEPLAAGADPVLLPAGTRVLTRGRVTVPLAAAGWEQDGRRVPLTVDGGAFSGALPVMASGTWRLAAVTADGAPLEGDPPVLVVTAVPDSAPVLAVPVPGADTTAPVSLRQPVVVDVRDDYRVTRVELVSRRVSRLGVKGEARTEPIPLPEDGVERAVLQWVLDLNDRGFLPGDTAYFRVRAWDNAPAPHGVESREYALRLPSMAELRAQARREADALSAAADSLAERQREVERATEDLVTEGRREGGEVTNRPGEALEYRATERAGELAQEQSSVVERARELRERLRELSDAAWEAGLTDPEWHRQLADLQKLLEQAVTPELQEALQALQEAMERLDAPGMQEALQRMAEAQRRLREELERARELFERAAVEGEMTSLAADAEELAAQQEEWNREVAGRADSLMAAREEGLAERADSLARDLAGLRESMEQAGMDPTAAGPEQARAAGEQMQQAADAAARGNPQRARQAGEQAASQLGPLAEQLRSERDRLREQWRSEVLEAMDHALIETAQLAQRQDAIRKRMERGEAGADVRAEQAAVRDGVDQVIERVQGAAGQNALVSPRLATALGYAKLKMTGAVDLLQRANPNLRGAQNEAAQALDGLNAVAYQLMRSRSDVAAAQSGSGLQEAIERMAQLAQQQQGLANQAGGLLPMMQQGGEMLMQELRMMAQRQRQLARELERLRGEGVGSAEELAEEAQELARELERGVLDRGIVERQERLFRRLLDQGRTLRGPEEDEQQRRSEAARPGNVQLPDGTVQRGAGPRYRYPGWEELQKLSPEERRLILDYFRRLNERGGGRP